MAVNIQQPCDQGVIYAKPCVSPCRQQAKVWVLAATILGSSTVFISNTVINVALPTLQSQLGATASDTQWVMSIYSLLQGSLVLVGGALGDRLGRRRVFVLGVGLFAIASLACGFADSVNGLIFARAVQGMGGALLIPGSLAIISASFPENERGAAIGLWSGFTAISTAIGPILGGWLIETLSWRWGFWMNIPLTLAIVIISLRLVPESYDSNAPKQLDYTGALLVAAGLGAIVYGLMESSNLGFGSWLLWSAIALGVFLLMAFVRVETHVRNPMMPVSLFRSRMFVGTNLLTLLIYANLGGVLFFFPFNLIQVQGYSTTAASAALVPFPLMMFVLSRWSGGLVDQYGARRPLMFGPLVVALGYGLMILPGVGGSYWLTFFPAALVLGLGMAISVAPLTTAVMGSVEDRYVGTASGVNNAVSTLASLLAIALLGIVMLVVFSSSLTAQTASLDLPEAARQFLAAQAVNLAAADIPSGLSPPAQQAVETAINWAFVIGFRTVVGIAVGLALLGSAIAAVTIERQPSRNQRI